MSDVTLREAEADLTLTAHMENQIHSARTSCSDGEMTTAVSHE